MIFLHTNFELNVTMFTFFGFLSLFSQLKAPENSNVLGFAIVKNCFYV